MNKLKKNKLLSLLIVALIAVFGLTGYEKNDINVDKQKSYSDKVHVAAYIEKYDALPDNYITKDEAYDLGWDNKEGNLWEVAPEKSIGGDMFYNREAILPKKEGRTYFECDIDYNGGYRNGKRIVFSNDGLIYYTDDHYESFENLGDE